MAGTPPLRADPIIYVFKTGFSIDKNDDELTGNDKHGRTGSVFVNMGSPGIVLLNRGRA
jgi:hypothetical protein